VLDQVEIVVRVETPLVVAEDALMGRQFLAGRKEFDFVYMKQNFDFSLLRRICG